jgi:hypothetical protein
MRVPQVLEVCRLYDLGAVATTVNRVRSHWCMEMNFIICFFRELIHIAHVVHISLL